MLLHCYPKREETIKSSRLRVLSSVLSPLLTSILIVDQKKEIP
jgi:hypothetical protein